METLDVYGATGQPIELPIGPGPATGHHWVLELPPGVERIADAEPDPAPDAGTRLGQAAGGRLRVTAGAGDHVLIARLTRPWESRAIREVRIALHVS